MSDKSHVLLALPEGYSREQLRSLFLQSGFGLTEAASATEVLVGLRGLPDLVVLGRRLPDGDSLRLLPQLKVSEDEFLPVLAVCGPQDQGDESGAAERVEALQAGADDSVSLPCDPAELLARVRALLRQKRTHERIRTVQRDLERMVASDPLTGLFNRRALIERLGQEFERVDRYEGSLALAMVDLDGFKPINDQYGHLFGDLVLKAVATALLGNVRTLDIAARFGGDEFALVLPQTDSVGARRVCERILRAISELEVRHGSACATVTVSLGLAFFPCDGVTTPEQLIDAADEALYRAKRAGRNRLCTTGDAPGVVGSVPVPPAHLLRES